MRARVLRQVHARSLLSTREQKTVVVMGTLRRASEHSPIDRRELSILCHVTLLQLLIASLAQHRAQYTLRLQLDGCRMPLGRIVVLSPRNDLDEPPLLRALRSSAAWEVQVISSTASSLYGASALFIDLADVTAATNIIPLRQVALATPLIGLYRGSVGDCPRSSMHPLISIALDDTIDAEARDCGDLIDRRVALASRKRLRSLTVDCLESMIGPRTRTLIEFGIDRGHEPLSVEQAAQALRVDRRTLALRSRDEGVLAPGFLLGWCRILVVIQLLELTGASVRRAATDLQFSSASALRNMIKRYTGVCPLSMIRMGGLEFNLDLFRRQIRRHPSGEVSPAQAMPAPGFLAAEPFAQCTPSTATLPPDACSGQSEFGFKRNTTRLCPD